MNDDKTYDILYDDGDDERTDQHDDDGLGQVAHELAHDAGPEEQRREGGDGRRGGGGDGAGDLLGPVDGGADQVLPLLHVPVDVLDDDDGVVDQHPQRHDQPEEHDHVQRHPEGGDEDERQEHGERDGQRDEEGVAHAHEEEQHADHQEQAGDDAVLQLADHVVDELRLVAEDLEAHALGPIGHVLGGQRLHRRRHLEDVRARALGDGDRDRGAPVHPCVGGPVGEAVDDPGHVAHEDRPVADPLDGDVLDLRRPLDLAGDPQQVAGVARLHLAAGHVDVLVGDGPEHVVEGEPVVREAQGVDLHPDLPLAPAAQGGVEHAVDPADLFRERYAAFLVESVAPLAVEGAQQIGSTTSAPDLQIGSESLPLSDLLKSWESPLEAVYRTQTDSPHQEIETFRYTTGPQIGPPREGSARPLAIIPAFPGTNSEYDSARSIRDAGGEAEILVFRNLSPQAVDESLQALADSIGFLRSMS